MYRLGSQILGAARYWTSTATPITIESKFDWQIKWYHQSGGIKKYWFWGMDNVPIKEFDFEVNKKLMGSGSLTLTNIDFLVHSFDQVDIFYLGTQKYRGFVDSLPDSKGGKLNLIPLSKQLEERVINSTYSSQSITAMLQDIITNTSGLNILWTSSKVNITSTVLYSRSFKWVTPKKAIDDLIDILPATDWGVDAGNFFNVYKTSTTLGKVIANCEDKLYTELSHEINDERIKATRYQVTVKSTVSGGQTVRVGQVGYDTSTGSYPTLSIEKLKRRKDDVYNVSFAATTTYALNSAYQDLVTQATLSENITLNNFRFDQYDPEINTYVKVIDDYEKVLFPLKNISNQYITDSTSYWTNVTLSTTDYVQGTGSIALKGSNPTDSLAIFDFSLNKHFLNWENFVFMIKSAGSVGKCINVSFSSMTSSLFAKSYGIYVNGAGVWEMKTIVPTEQNFRYIGFRYATTYGSTQYFWIDDINIYNIDRNEYYGNVVQKKYKCNNQGFSMDLTLNDYETLENQDLFQIQKDIQNIKEIQLT